MWVGLGKTSIVFLKYGAFFRGESSNILAHNSKSLKETWSFLNGAVLKS